MNKNSLDSYLNKAKSSNNYFTVKQYFDYLSIEISHALPPYSERLDIYKSIGLKAKAICWDRDLATGNEKNREGIIISSYPERILAEAIYGHHFPQQFPNYSEELETLYPVTRIMGLD